MQINVKRIPVVGETLEGSEPPSILELEDADVRFERDIKYSLQAQLQGGAVLVTGKLETPVTLRCSRCLKSFQKPVCIDEFIYHKELEGEDFVDLTQNIREDIILELPQRALCRPDCRGLCAVCGKDLNEDLCRCQPAHGDLRWEALEQLKLKVK